MLAARILLAAIFLVAGIAKLLDREGARRALLDFGVPGVLAPWLAVGLPVAECVVAVALIPLATAWAASLAALCLLLVFTLAIGVNLARGRKPDCHCFGQIHSAPAGPSTLIRNALLAGVAAFVAWNGGASPGSSVLAGLAELTRIEQLGVLGGLALLCLGGVQAALLLQVLRQQGRILLRLEALEGEGADPATEDPEGSHPALGLPIGAQAPRFRLQRAGGAEVSLESLLHADKPLLLFFTNPKCGPCMSLIPEVTRWHAEKSSALDIVLVSEGTAADNLAKMAGQRAPPVLLQEEREVAESYQAYGTPAAVLILPDGTVGSALAMGADPVRTLIRESLEWKRANSPAVKVGEEPPPLELLERNGKRRSLASFRGSPTLLLFWNPGCGFCAKMLDDLKRWDADPPPGAPRLVVVSSGTAEQNRALGLRAPVMTDSHAAASSVFGAHGTPMAVLLDAQGRVASRVAAGAQAVFALAGSSLAEATA